MAIQKGKSTLILDNQPSIVASASVVGKKEGEGPCSKNFDMIIDDGYFGETTWEKAESKLQKTAVNLALKKNNLTPNDIDILFAGDLLNQCIGSVYGMRDFKIPFVGLYGACSTMAESLIMASLFIEGGFAKRTCAVTSSHFCSAERQFRFPLEYGCQRTPTAQWTATASGCAILEKHQENKPFVKAVTIGTVADYGINDVNNMGAAMMPAANDTILTFFKDTGHSPEDFDKIVTGDLSAVGSELLIESLKKEGLDISEQHRDCGLMLYDRNTQNVDAGGSGCGCSASVLCSTLLKELYEKQTKNILFIATGALMSPTSLQQGETIPGIAHLLHISI